MEKRIPKLSLQNEKVQSSCVWGMVDIFDFGKGWSNQKLLTNGRRTVQSTVSDIEHLRKVQTIGSCSGKSQVFEVGTCLEKHESGAFDQSLKNLLKEEFATLKKSKKQKEASKKQLEKSDFELVLKQLQDDHKKPSKTCMKLADQLRIQRWKDKFLLGPEQYSGSTHEILLDKQNLEAMFGDICSQIYQENIYGGDIQKVITPSRYNELDEVNMQLLQITAKAFVDQTYKDGISSKSKYFSDASEILNLNMDLFLKLLQDSNSLLQFPARDNERMKLYLDSRPSERGSSVTRNNQDPEDTMKIQKRNLNNPLWKKLKDRYGCSSNGNTTCQTSKKIVILKPISKSKRNSEDVSCQCSSLHAHQSSKNKGHNMKSNYFSFKDIKRKFKQAVGENQQKQHLFSMDEHLRRLARKKHLLKDADTENSSGPCKGKSAVPPHAKRRETAASGETVCKNLNSSPCSSPKQRQLDIFMEAKRHLSERLRNLDMGEISERKEAPRTLKMVLSSPEHDHFLTPYSPKRDKMNMSNTLQNEKGKEMDFPSLSKQTEELPSCDCRRCDNNLEISEFRPKISKKLHADPEPSGSADILKANEVLLQRSSNLLEAPYELNSSYDANSNQGTETTKKYEDNRYMDSSDLAVPSENHPLRPFLGSSRSLTIHELEITNTAKYKEEHASPVSVLEPFSPEDVYSPIFVADKQYESSLQPRRLDFDDYSQVFPQEDPKSNQNLFMDAEESLHLYVRAVMEASELSFDDIYIKGPSTEDVLYTCIADEMGSCLIESYTELQLLFDCIHEILLGLYESHFGCPPWLSFLRQRIRPLPLEKDVIDEVVKEVNTTLLPKMEQQPMLNELMKKDIVKSGSWIDLCPDAEQILIQIAEEVLQDSIVDTILEVQV